MTPTDQHKRAGSVHSRQLPLLPVPRGCREYQVKGRSVCFPFYCTEDKEIESLGVCLCFVFFGFFSLLAGIKAAES